MTVTTGARGSISPTTCAAFSSSLKASGSSSLAVIALWPISSTTIIAVSWSSCWLIVTIWPSFISCLMTSEALTDILCARSATEMVSGTCTSWMTCFGRRLEVAAPESRSRPPRRAAARRAPARTARARAGAARRTALAGFAALLGGVVGPARGQLLGLDGLLVARLGARRRGAAPGAALALWIVPLMPAAGRPASAASGFLARPAPSWARTSSRGWRRPRPRRPCGGPAGRSCAWSSSASASAALITRTWRTGSTGGGDGFGRRRLDDRAPARRRRRAAAAAASRAAASLADLVIGTLGLAASAAARCGVGGDLVGSGLLGGRGGGLGALLGFGAHARLLRFAQAALLGQLFFLLAHQRRPGRAPLPRGARSSASSAAAAAWRLLLRRRNRRAGRRCASCAPRPGWCGPCRSHPPA